MASSLSQTGKIITFYSYKGGTGRSMALANIACLLAKQLAKTSQRVLVMDWDLEAPGLHRFFSAKSDLPEYEQKPGVINYFHSLYQLLEESPDLKNDLAGPEGWQLLNERLPLDDYVIPDVVGGVDFMRAGRFGPDYPKLVGSFNWIEFFNRHGSVIRTFREMVAGKYVYILVDSRTGLTDVSGICTTLLPEKLVGVFTPNLQSLRGLCDIVRQAIEYRSKSDDFRPLSVFPLASRVENAEKDLRERWRKAYQREFEDLFRDVHGSEQCDLTSYFDTVLLPHVSYYAYGENIAVLQERPDAISLSGAYQRFFDRLTGSDYAWESPDIREVVAAPIAEIAKPANEKYDAFLSYVASDAKDVSQVNYQLRRQGVKCFFALHDMAPGENAAAGISKAMAESKTILLFVGPTGSGTWQDQESLAVLEDYAKNGSKRMIPVLLPKAPSSEELRLPNFLRNVQWVDLRSDLNDQRAIENLIWGLTGKRSEGARPLSRARIALASACVGVVLALLLLLLWPHKSGGVAPSVNDLKLKQFAEELWQKHQFDQSEQIWQELAKVKGPLQNEATQQVAQIEQKRANEQRRFDEGEVLLNDKKDYSGAQQAFQDVIQMNLWHSQEASRELAATNAGLSAVSTHKQEQDYYNQGVILYQAKDFENARKQFRAIVDLNVAGSSLKPQAENYLARIRALGNEQTVYDAAMQDMKDENWTDARDQLREVINRKGSLSADAQKQMLIAEKVLQILSTVEAAIRANSFRDASAELNGAQQWPKTYDKLMKDLRLAEQLQFDQIKSSAQAAETKGDPAAIQHVQDDLHSFEGRAEEPSLISASKDLEKRINSAYSTAMEKNGDKAAFDAAVSHFEQARQKKDVELLSHGVSQEFQKIANGTGIYRENAALFVKTTIPNAIQALAQTSGKLVLPALSCGPGTGAIDVPSVGGSVPCGQLDAGAPLQWVGIPTMDFPDIANSPGKLPYTLTVMITVDPSGNVTVAKEGEADKDFLKKLVEASKYWKTTAPRSGGKPVTVRFPLTIIFQR
jgi:cellulose biosynthesis protein BcsQ